MKARRIEHNGTVERIMSHTVVVSIAQETACAACSVASLCHSADKEQKSIEIVTSEASKYEVGQPVTIVGEVGLGLRAVIWAYVVPILLVVGVLMFVSYLTAREGLAAVIALSSLVPYYIILYGLRGMLQRRFSFSLK